MPEAETEAAEALTPKQLARMLDSDARTVRKFLRGQFGKVGQGNRWGLDPSDLHDFTAAWLVWRTKIDQRKLQTELAEVVEADDEAEDEMEVE